MRKAERSDLAVSEVVGESVRSGSRRMSWMGVVGNGMLRTGWGLQGEEALDQR